MKLKKPLFLLNIAFYLCSCSYSSSTVKLKSRAQDISVSYSETKEESYLSFLNKLNNFYSKFCALFENKFNNSKDNNCVSPASIFMALGMLSECVEGESKEEILNFLEMDSEEIRKGVQVLYRTLNTEYKIDNKMISKESMMNSLWIDKSFRPKEGVLNILSNEYFADSFHADFVNDNVNANKDFTDYVKKNTDGLINKNFDLSTETLIALVNVLYAKDLWKINNDLPLTSKNYELHNSDGSKRTSKLLQGDYYLGKSFETESYKGFYSKLQSQLKLYFIVPFDTNSLNTTLSSKYYEEIRNLSYETVSEELKEIYHTRCLFPEFTCESDVKLNNLLIENNVSKIFELSNDFYPLSDQEMKVSKIQHTTKLNVNKTGVEGAAVTVVETCGSAGPNEEYTDIYLDFVVDRPFIYFIEGSYSNLLFSGIVNKL